MASYPTREELTGMRRADVLRASPRMFDSNLLDKLSRVHWSVPLFIFGPAIVVALVVSFSQLAVWQVPLFALGGYLFWTLTEYWLHRIVFHFEPDRGIGARLHWIIHGVHHDHPNDPLRLVMPPSVSVPLAALFLLLFAVVLGTPQAYAASAGFWAGYLAYDMLHYYMHHLPGGRKPTAWVPRKLHELHMRHHFKEHDKGYGVSAPFWDHVFGTATQGSQRNRVER
ncbi:MAG TPA: sterol desaturase family protein [Conexibacter sp.]|jgi:sterol desaturase/sphingolipid hydroxylase (fatty acid hydroxylase superfamily)